jgi:predicted lactoylglutathione lyase
MLTCTSGSFVTAVPDSRLLWTSAARGVVRATTSHQVSTVQTHTPRHVGCLLTKATTAQFNALGANVDINTVSDVSGDVRMFEKLVQGDLNGGTCTDMMYNLTIHDSDATVYNAPVYLDDAMLRSCVGERSVPMVFYAMQQLDSIRASMPELAETLQRAFGTGSESGCTTTRAVPAMHCVASSGTTSRRMFPTGSRVNSAATSMLSTQTDKTVLFNNDRDVTHHVTTYSVRAIDMSPSISHGGSDRYLVAQNVKIEDVGGVYSANVTMSIVGTDARGVMPRGDAVTHKMHPYVSLDKDPGLVNRTSTMHVFTNGNHYSMLVTHMHNSNSTRSLQLSAYASMNALCVSGKATKSDIDRIMKSASMETLFDAGDIPVVVARKSSSPCICVLVPGIVSGAAESALSSPGSPKRVALRMRDDEKCYLVDMKNDGSRQTAVPVRTLDIESLPGPVQNALRRQWGI